MSRDYRHLRAVLRAHGIGQTKRLLWKIAQACKRDRYDDRATVSDRRDGATPPSGTFDFVECIPCGVTP